MGSTFAGVLHNKDRSLERESRRGAQPDLPRNLSRARARISAPGSQIAGTLNELAGELL